MIGISISMRVRYSEPTCGISNRLWDRAGAKMKYVGKIKKLIGWNVDCVIELTLQIFWLDLLFLGVGNWTW